MTTEQAIEVLTEMQKWRRSIPPYDGAPCEMPYSPRQWGEAVDMAIEAMKQQQWKNPAEEMPVDDLGYDDIVSIATNGQVHEWDIIAWRNAWHTGDARARHTWLWTYKPNR